MEKYKVLQYPSLEALNAEINKLADKYAPVGNLIYAGDSFIQQVELTEEGEELMRKEEALEYAYVSDPETFKAALENKKDIYLNEDIALDSELVLT